MAVDPNILIVVATLVAALSISSLVAGWAARAMSPVAGLSLLIGLGLLIFVHLTTPGGLAPLDIPDAFIAVAALIR